MKLCEIYNKAGQVLESIILSDYKAWKLLQYFDRNFNKDLYTLNII